MHREKVLNTLQEYNHKFPKESNVVDQFYDFVIKNNDCFERSLLIGHITGSAVLLNPNKSKVLLTHHAKLNKWIQLGGHADGESEPLKVAFNEAVEESGITEIDIVYEWPIDIDIHKIPESKNVPEHLHFDLRYLFVSHTEEFEVSHESLDLQWFAIDRAIEIADSESMTRLLNKTKVLLN